MDLPNEFINNIKPLFDELNAACKAHRALDLSLLTEKDIQKQLIDLDELELNLMIVWAESTVDINPNMLRNIHGGRITYGPMYCEYLRKLFNEATP